MMYIFLLMTVATQEPKADFKSEKYIVEELGKMYRKKYNELLEYYRSSKDAGVKKHTLSIINDFRAEPVKAIKDYEVNFRDNAAGDIGLLFCKTNRVVRTMEVKKIANTVSRKDLGVILQNADDTNLSVLVQPELAPIKINEKVGLHTRRFSSVEKTTAEQQLQIQTAISRLNDALSLIVKKGAYRWMKAGRAFVVNATRREIIEIAANPLVKSVWLNREVVLPPYISTDKADETTSDAIKQVSYSTGQPQAR